MKLYLSFLKIHWRSQMQHLSSFMLMTLGQFLATFFGILGIFFIFQRFHQVKGFSLEEVLLCATMISLSFALAELVGRGFDQFPQMIGNGEFDRMLVRPTPLWLQIMTAKIEFSRIGRMLQAIVVFTYCLGQITIQWTFWRVFGVGVMIVGGSLLFILLFWLGASLSFFTLEGLEVMNILTDGGREFGQYPFSIYGKRVLKFLTYLIPLALVQYYPFLYLIGHSQRHEFIFLPLLSLLFGIPVAKIWQMGRRRYQSIGS